MPDVVAKTMAVISAVLLALAIAILYVTSRPPSGTQEVVAEFRNAFPLIEGMHVRVDGAIAGSVGTIEVNDEGLAAVTLLVEEEIEDPTADASAAIRQGDTTGDSYVAYDPGDEDAPLGDVDGIPTIVCDAKTAEDPCSNTLVAPRFDDLLNAFGPSERAGIQLILVELARAVDKRGGDLNQAALELRPALVAASRALDEVNGQNAALRSLIRDTEAVTAQAADRRVQLNHLIESLGRTLEATTSELPALDAGLLKLPPTVDRAESTLAALTSAATATTPLARELASGAPQLAETLRLAPPFIDDAEFVVDRATPTLKLTRDLLAASEPTIKADPQRVVTGPFDLAPAVSNLFRGILGGDTTFDAFFGAPVSQRGFGAVAVEPGNQAGYPPGYDRNFLRISAVVNCEAFGVPIRPGCLLDAITNLRGDGTAGSSGLASDGNADDPVPDSGDGGGGSGGGGQGGNDDVAETLDGLGLDDTLDGLDLDGALDGLGLGGGAQGTPPATGQEIQDLLDFLLR